MHSINFYDLRSKDNLLILLARLAGFEPATLGLEVRSRIFLLFFPP
jgi:hypothetical protein